MTKKPKQIDQLALRQLRVAWIDLQMAMSCLEQDGEPYPEREQLEQTMRRLLDHLDHPPQS